jgi:tRNA(Met) cytidine acetyltransferase
LLQFWQGSGFAPVHLGMSRNAASGMHAALVLKPLSDRGEAVLHEAQLKFAEHFPVMLAESYRDLEPALVQQLFNQLLNAVSKALFTLRERDWQDVKSFVSSARDYEVNSVPLWKLTCMGLANAACAAGLTETQLTLLTAKVLQKKPWNEIVSDTDLRGRKQALAELRLAAAKLYQYCAGEQA